MKATARIVVVVATAALGGWALLHFAWRPHQCNAEISLLTARTDAAERTPDGYDRIVRARRNLQDLARLRDTCPTAVRVPMLTGANEELAGRPEDAERSYRSALSIEPRPEIYVAIAMVAIEQGRIEESIESYVTASRFAPATFENIPSHEIKERVRDRLGAR